MIPDILDGRPGGVPDPRLMGPSIIQIGTEGGILPAPAVLDDTPVGYEQNKRNVVVLNVSAHTLMMGPAERADVIIDFSQFAGKTVILYNDSPAPVPAGDPRYDYYTGDPDFSITGGDNYQGGAPTTLPGYGPNTRTIMQFRVAAVSGGTMTVTTNETAYVTGQTLVGLRNNYPGYVGMKIVVGANPVTVSALGRIMASGNSGTHTVKLVDAGTGTDVPGGSVSLTMNGTVGQFQYASLVSPVTLAAGAAYYVVSKEAYGGDAWYDFSTLLSTTTAAAVASAVYGPGSGAWNLVGSANSSYVPVSLKILNLVTNYSSPPPTPFDVTALQAALPAAFAASQPTPIVPESVYNPIYAPSSLEYVTGAMLSTLRNNYPGYVGMKIVVGANPVTVSALGRIMANGNSGTHTVKLVNGSTGKDVPGGSVSLSMNGTVGQFQYASLASPVTLSASAAYYLVSQETSSGDTWYDFSTRLSTTAVATDVSAVYGSGSGVWNVIGGANQCYVPVSFKYLALNNTYARIYSTNLTFAPIGSGTAQSMPLQPKAIQELFDPVGRMNATLGVELPFTTSLIQTTIPYGYNDPATEILTNNEVQLWKITHNGVDTHPVHFHLVNVQVLNRVGWDGAIRPPDANELGWKETVRMNPLEDIVVALKMAPPSLPFPLPDSVRALNPALPLGDTTGFTGIDPLTGNPITVTNVVANFGWEYVWHCHILGHEENDFMRPFILLMAPAAPAGLQATASGGNQVDLTWSSYVQGASLANALVVQRAIVDVNTGLPGPFADLQSLAITATTYPDTSVTTGTRYAYQIVAYNNGGTASAPSPSANATP